MMQAQLNKVKEQAMSKYVALMALITLFVVSPLAMAGLLGGIMVTITGGIMTIVGVYVVYLVNDSLGYSDANTTSIYNKIMKAFIILGTAMIIIGAKVIIDVLTS